MLNQQNYGLTVEDLEKAASVRLFEKAAAAEGINLDELSEAQVDELYSNYQSQSEENTMNEEIIDLFEKQAAYEGVDLESLSDDELAHVYNNFVTNLAEEVELDEDAVDYEDEATEKLAEAEILGRHMARAYMDEVEKVASIQEAAELGDLEDLIEVDYDTISAADLQELSDAGYELVKEAGAKKVLAKYVDNPMRSVGRSIGRQVKKTSIGKKMVGDLRKKSTQRLLGYGTVGAGATASGAAQVAMKRRHDRRMKELEKEAALKYIKGAAKGIDKAVQGFGRTVGGKLKNTGIGKKMVGDLRKKSTKRLVGYGTAGVGAAGVGAAGYGASRMMNKEASFEELVDSRAAEFLEFGKEANYDDSHVDIAALDYLDDMGYDILPVLEDLI